MLMPIRALVLVALASLWLAALPAFGGPTDREKFEKKVKRYAQPLASASFAKPRGLCACGPNSQNGLAGQTGVLVYEFNEVPEFKIMYVTCKIAVFDGAGASELNVVNSACDDWTLLSR